MSEKEKPGSDAAVPVEEKKKGSKKLIVIAAIVVLLGGIGGGGFYYWKTKLSSGASSDDASKKKSHKKTAQTDSVNTENAADETSQDKTSNSSKNDKAGGDPLKSSLPNDEDVKKIVELPPFIVNLADTEQARYLRMTVSLGIDSEDGGSEKPDQLFMTRVRNTILAVLSVKKSDEILSVEGKTKLRKELLEAAQAASDAPRVQAIYITDFIVQL